MKPPTSPTPSHANSYSTYGGASPLPNPANSSRSCLSATTKSYKYLRRLLKFDQMDFEFALWQMLYLFVSPQKVYRNFNYRKRKCRMNLEMTTGMNLFWCSQKRNHNLPEMTQHFWSFWSSVFVVSVEIRKCRWNRVWRNISLIFSYVIGLRVDTQLVHRSKHILPILCGHCWLSVSRFGCRNNIVDIHQQVLTQQSNSRFRYWVGLHIRRAFECIFSSIDLIAFYSAVLLQW